jgi:RNA polymerase sigma factor (sigma-70 family)
MSNRWNSDVGGVDRSRAERAGDRAPNAGHVTPLPFPVHAPESALVDALRNGHPGAVKALYERYADAVSRALTSIFGLEEDLTDFVRGAFVAAVGGVGDLADPERLWGWLLGEVVVQARRELRQRRLRSAAHRMRRRFAGRKAPVHPVSTALEDDGAAAVAAYEVLEGFPVEERLVFALRVIEGLSFVETCEACRSSLRVVRRLLGRARRRFVVAAGRHAALSRWLESASGEDGGADGWVQSLGAVVASVGDGARRRRPATFKDRERDLVLTAMLAAGGEIPPRRSRRSWIWIAAGGVAAAGVAAAALLALLGPPAPSGTAFSAFDRGGARDGHAGEWLAAAPASEALASFTDGSRLRLAPHARGRVVEAGASRVAVTLERGSMNAAIAAGARRWMFQAGPVDVVPAVGPANLEIDVRWDPDREQVRVVVLEGRAVVSGACLAGPRSLGAGGRLELDCSQRQHL